MFEVNFCCSEARDQTQGRKRCVHCHWLCGHVESFCSQCALLTLANCVPAHDFAVATGYKLFWMHMVTTRQAQRLQATRAKQQLANGHSSLCPLRKLSTLLVPHILGLPSQPGPRLLRFQQHSPAKQKQQMLDRSTQWQACPPSLNLPLRPQLSSPPQACLVITMSSATQLSSHLPGMRLSIGIESNLLLDIPSS